MDEDLLNEAEAAIASRSPSLLDKWLEEQSEETKAAFEESIRTFSQVVGPNFGWPRFAKYLQSKYPGYPLRRDGTIAWCKKHYPELFSG